MRKPFSSLPCQLRVYAAAVCICLNNGKKNKTIIISPVPICKSVDVLEQGRSAIFFPRLSWGRVIRFPYIDLSYTRLRIRFTTQRVWRDTRRTGGHVRIIWIESKNYSLYPLPVKKVYKPTMIPTALREKRRVCV